jgi:hypothetical protein
MEITEQEKIVRRRRKKMRKRVRKRMRESQIYIKTEVRPEMFTVVNTKLTSAS